MRLIPLLPLLALRLAPQEPEPAPVWASGTFEKASLDGTVADEGAVSLAGDWSDWLAPDDPSKWNVITDLAVFEGRLVAVACYSRFRAAWTYSAGTEFCVFDPASGTWSVEHSTAGALPLECVPVGDRLIAPDFRAAATVLSQGKWSDGGLRLPAGTLHSIKVIGWKDRLVACGSSTKGGSPAGNGFVWESTDGGQTWTELHRTAEVGRITDLAVHEGRLWANSRGQTLISWDGKTWTDHPVRFKGADVKAVLGTGLSTRSASASWP